MKKISLLILLGLATIKITAQQSLSDEQLKEDLETLGNITVQLSPKLTAADGKRIDDLVTEKSQALDGKSYTPIEFFNFLAAIDFETKFDEHASLSLTQEVMMPLLTTSKLFPFPVKIIGNHIVVNALNLEIPYGSKLLSINGIVIDSVLHAFTPKYDDTFIKRRLERQFSMVYLIKNGSSENFNIEYSSPSKPKLTLQKIVRGIDFETYQKVFSKPVFPLHQDKQAKLINTHFIEEASTYYLQLNSFNWNMEADKGSLHFLHSEHKNFQKRFNKIFKEINDTEAKNLIIDLRFNYGGNARVPAILYSYLAQSAFNEDVSIHMQNFEVPHQELVKKIGASEIEKPKAVEDFLKRYKKNFVKSKDSDYVWKLVDNQTVEPSKRAFNGKVYLLVSGRSISASAYFAALFKANERGVIVGEEMGGSFKALTAGKILTYQLPNSKLELGTPIMEVNFSEELSEKISVDRIRPDVEFTVQERLIFFREQKDIEMKKALELIRQGQ